jgi:hypothetical protein
MKTVNITITILDIIHLPVYLKHDVSETVLSPDNSNRLSMASNYWKIIVNTNHTSDNGPNPK